MKMLSEMECREALDDIYVLAIPCQEEVFEHRSQYLKERYILIKQLIKEHFDPQPYTFRELNKEMWVWDDKEKVCFQCNPMISTDMAQCVTYMSYWYNDGEDYDKFHEEYDEFEENRFYPLTKALQYQGKEDE